jgi:hypothetical protein
MKALNLIGKKFGKLTVLRPAPNQWSGKWRTMWHCVCECGKKVIAHTDGLRAGTTTTCKCRLKNGNPIHGMRFWPEYQVWLNIKQRCLNPKNDHYKYYGQRGIKVCGRWINSFPSFIKDMGRRPKSRRSVERLNNNGNYCPSNCVWATCRQQSRNQRTNIKITHLGKTRIAKDWSKMLGIGYAGLCLRARQNLPVKQILKLE